MNWRVVLVVVGVTAVTASLGVMVSQTWLRAHLGGVNSQLQLAYGYAIGNGVEQDDFEATRWYRRAAEQGDARGARVEWVADRALEEVGRPRARAEVQVLLLIFLSGQNTILCLIHSGSELPDKRIMRRQLAHTRAEEVARQVGASPDLFISHLCHFWSIFA